MHPNFARYFLLSRNTPESWCLGAKQITRLQEIVRAHGIQVLQLLADVIHKNGNLSWVSARCEQVSPESCCHDWIVLAHALVISQNSSVKLSQEIVHVRADNPSRRDLVVVSHAILNVVEKVVDELLLKDLSVILCADTDHQQPHMQMGNREPGLEVVGQSASINPE